MLPFGGGGREREGAGFRLKFSPIQSGFFTMQ